MKKENEKYSLCILDVASKQQRHELIKQRKMNQTLTPIDEIKDLYSQVKKKIKFIEAVANDIGRSPKALRNNWFSEFWSIPKEHQPRVKELLETTIKNQA